MQLNASVRRRHFSLGVRVTDAEFLAAVEAELNRVGLSLAVVPGLAISAAAQDPFLTHLRALPSGAGWRDVFPDLPADWRGWNAPSRYRSFGPYDYPEPPAGPALHVQWPDRDGERSRVGAVVDAARRARWPVYGAGLIPIDNPAWPTMDAFIILERGTDGDTTWEFVDWLHAHTDASLAAIPRNGSETYA